MVLVLSVNVGKYASHALMSDIVLSSSVKSNIFALEYLVLSAWGFNIVTGI